MGGYNTAMNRNPFLLLVALLALAFLPLMPRAAQACPS